MIPYSLVAILQINKMYAKLLKLNVQLFYTETILNNVILKKINDKGNFKK